MYRPYYRRSCDVQPRLRPGIEKNPFWAHCGAVRRITPHTATARCPGCYLPRVWSLRVVLAFTVSASAQEDDRTTTYQHLVIARDWLKLILYVDKSLTRCCRVPPPLDRQHCCMIGRVLSISLWRWLGNMQNINPI